MRRFLNIILEAGESKPTKTGTKPKFDFLSDLESHPVAQVSPKGERKGPRSLRQAGAAQTRSKWRQARGSMMAHPGARQAMAGILDSGMDDEISDAEAARNAGLDNPENLPALRRNVNNDNLPAVVNQALTLGDRPVQPEWHQVKHLPGYMVNAIRAGGREVFRQFAPDTPIEDIQMICTLLNPQEDVRGVMAWVRENGRMEDEATMTFGGGIQADVRLWKTPEFCFLLVQDPMGQYVYAWVRTDQQQLKQKPVGLLKNESAPPRRGMRRK